MAWRCRFCAHDLPPKALKCPQCGEWLITAAYRWYYKHFFLEVGPQVSDEAPYDETEIASDLDKLGEQGWELASMVPRLSRAKVDGYFVTIKRRGKRIYDIDEAKAIENER